MTLLHAVLLGIVEGITEFLPISSTGHLILASHLLQLPDTEFQKSFDIAIQSGAILAVIVLYGRRLLVNRAVLLRVCVGFVPTAVIGLALHGFVKRYLLDNASVVLWSMLIGGLVILLFERVHRERDNAIDDLSTLTYAQAALIGVAQSIAIVPGVSRSAATIVGGLLLGLRRRAIVEFSFLLAIPTMLAATALDLLKSGHAFTVPEYQALAVGLLVSFLVALAAIRWLLRFIQTHTFTPFGIYRVLAAVAAWMVG